MYTLMWFANRNVSYWQQNSAQQACVMWVDRDWLIQETMHKINAMKAVSGTAGASEGRWAPQLTAGFRVKTSMIWPDRWRDLLRR
jgi:hypothetical protein